METTEQVQPPATEPVPSRRGGRRPGAGRPITLPVDGDTVWYWEEASDGQGEARWRRRPATILWVDASDRRDVRVMLNVQYRGSVRPVDNVSYSREPQAGCWTWRKGRSVI